MRNMCVEEVVCGRWYQVPVTGASLTTTMSTSIYNTTHYTPECKVFSHYKLLDVVAFVDNELLQFLAVL